MPQKRLKRILIVLGPLGGIILLIFFLSIQEQIEFNETYLNGKVKWLKETPYKVKVRKGKIEKLEIKSWGDFTDVNENFFNEEGKLIRTTIKPTPNKSSSVYSIKYIYSDEELLIRKEYFGSNPSPYSSAVLKYNKYGQCIQEDFQGSRSQFAYDSNGKLASERQYNTKGILEFTHSHSYPDKFVMLTDIFSHDAKWHLLKEFEMDEMGNPLKFRMGNSKVDLKKTKWETFKYEFDSHGNWIKQIRYVYGTPKYLVEREIKYY